MIPFVYQSPTKILFGREMQKQVGAECKKIADNVLLHYGGGSIKRSGLYDEVLRSLREAGANVFELGGVQPNPRVSLVREGIRLCREQDIGLLLAVGGGSAIDSAKAIAIGAKYGGDVWDLFTKRAPIADALPVATVLTIPAAGSETSPNSVITNEETCEKLGAGSPLMRPVFSVLNPALCFTLPAYQMACGVSDMLAHAMERYFTNTPSVDYSDRLLEATMRSIIHTAPRLLDNPSDYDAWSNIMWAGTVVHNGILGMGREEDWGSHGIEHQLSAVYDIAHGAGLAVVFPAWIKAVYRHAPARFVQYAQRVWDVDLAQENPERIILEGVRRLEAFYTSLGLPVRLGQLQIDDRDFAQMAERVTRYGPAGHFKALSAQDVEDIYRLAL